MYAIAKIKIEYRKYRYHLLQFFHAHGYRCVLFQLPSVESDKKKKVNVKKTTHLVIIFS